MPGRRLGLRVGRCRQPFFDPLRCQGESVLIEEPFQPSFVDGDFSVLFQIIPAQNALKLPSPLLPGHPEKSVIALFPGPPLSGISSFSPKDSKKPR